MKKIIKKTMNQHTNSNNLYKKFLFISNENYIINISNLKLKL